MKNLAFSLIAVALLFGCKKSSGDSTPPPNVNYIKIDDDKGELGVVPTAKISFFEAAYPEGPILNIGIQDRVADIDGSKCEFLQMSISIFEGASPVNEYKIENLADHSPSSAQITIFFHGIDISAGMTGKSGKLFVTRDANNKINSVKFENVPMDGSYEATASFNIKLK